MKFSANLRKATAIGGAMAALAFASVAVAAPTILKTVRLPNGGLYEVVFNPTTDDVYVAATSGQAAVVRLDGQTLTEEGRVSVATDPMFGLGLNNRTQMLYGSSTRRGSVPVVNLATGAVVANIRKSETENPHVRQVAVDEGRNKVYVTAVGGDSTAGPAASGGANEVWVIDGATNRLEKTISIPANRMTGLALDTARNRLFVTSLNGHEVIAVDIASGAVTGRWNSGGQGPINVVFDAAGNRLFVSHQVSGNLTVLNANTGAVLATVTTGAGALGVAFNPKLNQVYVSNRTAGTTTVVNGADYSVIANLQTGTLPQTVTIDHDTNLVYVTNKARGGGRGAAAGAPPPPVDEGGDTVTIIRP